MSASAASLLTLVAPKAIEERLIDVLLEYAATAASGFVMRAASGHGPAVVYRDVTERIRGRVQRLEVTVIASEAELAGLVDHLALTFPGLDVTWWISPLTASGTIG